MVFQRVDATASDPPVASCPGFAAYSPGGVGLSVQSKDLKFSRAFFDDCAISGCCFSFDKTLMALVREAPEAKRSPARHKFRGADIVLAQILHDQRLCPNDFTVYLLARGADWRRSAIWTASSALLRLRSCDFWSRRFVRVLRLR